MPEAVGFVQCGSCGFPMRRGEAARSCHAFQHPVGIGLPFHEDDGIFRTRWFRFAGIQAKSAAERLHFQPALADDRAQGANTKFGMVWHGNRCGSGILGLLHYHVAAPLPHQLEAVRFKDAP